MNVIVANKNEGLLNSLDIDVIKTINGEYEADEIIQTFSNFFFNRMFLDITAIKDYMNISNIQKLSMSLDIEKVIFLLDGRLMSDNNFLSKLISMGIYNFANTKESLLYLYNHPNSYKDVAHIHQLNMNTTVQEPSNTKNNQNNNQQPTYVAAPTRNAKVIGFKNASPSAGATTLVYMLKRYLSEKHYVVALEVNKNDFGYFNEKDMYSINQQNLNAAINKFGNASYILVDINNGNEDSCDDIVYLIEPSTIKLNKMMLINKDIFDKLSGKKIVLNKSMLGPKDITDFEYESRSKIMYNIPPLNDREMNEGIFIEFMERLESE
jgi:hypothetical protein